MPVTVELYRIIDEKRFQFEQVIELLRLERSRHKWTKKRLRDEEEASRLQREEEEEGQWRGVRYLRPAGEWHLANRANIRSGAALTTIEVLPEFLERDGKTMDKNVVLRAESRLAQALRIRDLDLQNEAFERIENLDYLSLIHI